MEEYMFITIFLTIIIIGNAYLCIDAILSKDPAYVFSGYIGLAAVAWISYLFVVQIGLPL